MIILYLYLAFFAGYLLCAWLTENKIRDEVEAAYKRGFNDGDDKGFYDMLDKPLPPLSLRNPSSMDEFLKQEKIDARIRGNDAKRRSF